MSTVLFSDLIEKAYRRLMGGVRERTVQLNGSLDDATESVTVDGPQTNGVAPGVILAVDLELLYVWAWNAESQVASVIRGYGGSTPAAHDDDALCYLNPRYNRYDIGVAINDDLLSMSANGVYRVGVAQVTWNPVYVGYDLGDVPAQFLDVLGVRFKIPPPYRNYPRITEWNLDRHNPDAANIPSGQMIVFEQGAFPGFGVYVTYSAPFIPLAALTDDATMTPTVNDPAPPFNGYGAANAVANLTNTMTDIPVLGAIIQLTLPGEIARNRMESQPDPRKAAEVPAGAITNSVSGLIIQRKTRLQEEADRLSRQLQFLRGW